MTENMDFDALLAERLGKRPKRDLIYAISHKWIKEFQESIKETSDRALLIVAAAWIEKLLEIRLHNEFAWGNARARKSLFCLNGPFATLSGKINAAYCAGWLEADVYHDIEIIKKVRNDFAHSVKPLSLDCDETRKLIESFQVPHRQYHDWGQIRAAANDFGIVLYTGEKPTDATEDLPVPGKITFGAAITVIVHVLIANLNVPIQADEEGTLFFVQLPDYMKEDKET